MTTGKVDLLAGEAQPGETRRAILACNDYLRMGPGRSLQKLRQIYTESRPEKPPTKHLATLKEWSNNFGWVRRSALYDAKVERHKNERRAEAMATGLALEYERIEELKAIYATLRGEFEKSGLWVSDIKLSARGDQVEVEVFSKALIDSMRGVLDDLAKETGGRRQRSVVENIDYSRLTDEQLQRIAAGEDPAQVILSDYTRSSS